MAKATKKPTKQANSFFQQRFHEGMGLLLLFCTIYLTLSLVTYTSEDPSFNVSGPSGAVLNSGGLVGAYVADMLLQFFCLSAFILPLVIGSHGIQMVAHKETQDIYVRLLTIPLLLVSSGILMQLWSPMPYWPDAEGIGNGGLVGTLASNMMLPLLGKFGTIALSSIFTLLCLMWWSGLTLDDLYRYYLATQRFITHWAVIGARAAMRFKFRRSLQIDLPLPTPPMRKVKSKVERPTAPIVMPAAREEEEKQEALPLNLSNDYQLPPLHLLEKGPENKEAESEDALQQNARQIEAQLANFGVKGEVTKICPGPVITIYELEPAPGVKTSAIIGLSNDLARAMSATAIRISPIPGRSVIGIEMPNRKRQMVTLRELLATDGFDGYDGGLGVALGVDTAGHPVYADISKMPHALIAGTTGSGKSVAMNAFILSLLYKMSPEQLRFVMIDPKMLELSIYNDIPHLLTPVIIDPHKASAALKWVVREMENRYKMMKDLGVKNIQSFNAKFAELDGKGEIPTKMVQTGFQPETGQPLYEEQPVCTKAFPYIVVVLDELADLMMVAGKEVEQSIARLAQMARAAGIHLLIATQRPSVDVITGLIKANVPTRISFSVTSKIDSRTVLDSMGAEQLLGKGDMLYMENGSNNLQRLHGAFVSEEECHAIADHVKTMGAPSYMEDIFKEGGSSSSGNGSDGGGVDSDDPLYRQAIEIVAKEQKASTSYIQRVLKIGYNRAAGIIDQMEADGLVSAANHVGKREVIIKQPPESGY